MINIFKDLEEIMNKMKREIEPKKKKEPNEISGIKRAISEIKNLLDKLISQLKISELKQ